MLIVGEKLNSVIEPVREAIQARNSAFILNLARKQVKAGAHFLDINAAQAAGSEPEHMTWLVKTIQDEMDVPLCIDSTDPRSIAAALKVHRGKAMINSISMEKKRLEEILPLALDYGCSVVALTMDERGIPSTSEQRIAIAEELVNVALARNMDLQDLYIDPLVLPVGVNTNNAVVFFESLREIKRRFNLKTISGLSNLSFSLPKRRLLNRHFLTICMSLGMDAAILDPLDQKLMTTITVTDLLMGRDSMCRNYLKHYRAGQLVD